MTFPHLFVAVSPPRWLRRRGCAHGQRALRCAAGRRAHLPHMGSLAWLGNPSLGKKWLPSGNLTDIAIENGPFIDGLPIKNGDFPWLC